MPHLLRKTSPFLRWAVGVAWPATLASHTQIDPKKQNHRPQNKLLITADYSQNSNTYLFPSVPAKPALPVSPEASRCIKHVVRIDPAGARLDADGRLEGKVHVLRPHAGSQAKLGVVG